MIALVLLAAAAPATAVDAELDFSRRAQIEGFWTAFRATAHEQAMMFVPKAEKAHRWLEGRQDPLLSYVWWPARAFVSCDGSTAVTTGPSVHGASRGYFTTVWERQPDGTWKWFLDHGHRLAKPRAAGERAKIEKASCRNLTPPARLTLTHTVAPAGGDMGTGVSGDRSLGWRWHVKPDGSRVVSAELWDGKQFRTILTDEVKPAAQ